MSGSRIVPAPTKTRPVLAGVMLLSLGSLAAGCASSLAWDRRLHDLDETLERAAAQGAERCAPRELALGRAHREFALTERQRGNATRAKEHLAIAEPNADAALFLSPSDRCGGEPSATPEPPVAPSDDPPPDPTDEPPAPDSSEEPPPVTDGPDADGDGIPDATDACPTRPEDRDGDRDEDGCPDSDDGDRDGVPNATDQCPTAAEDADGFMDEDGCPDPDNDRDGVADPVDACPDDAEDTDGFLDEDGCPDFDDDADGFPDTEDPCPRAAGDESPCPTRYPDVDVEADRLVLRHPIVFSEGTEVARESLDTLRTIARILADRPSMTLEIRGHWDASAPADEARRRSEARAEAVRQVLIDPLGVPASRLEARGVGARFPVASSDTQEGRSSNRRLEFRITNGGLTSPPSRDR